MINEKLLTQLWRELYGEAGKETLQQLIVDVKELAGKQKGSKRDPLWYKDAVVYSLYVDLFNRDFSGLESKLDYLQELGVNCLWLLPILDSPMKDAGFDIRRYDRVRLDLLGLDESAPDETRQAVFRHFLEKAAQRGMRVIFDIAINHTSIEHEWFIKAKSDESSPYRDYYIWNKDTQKYKETRLLFKGMCPSNWEKEGNSYFFHRFFEFQPDLNYRNPAVLGAMMHHFLYWIEQGVDGFRADAIPYLWKEEGTNCENLPKTHTIIKFIRAVLDAVRPGVLLLAEACQPPTEVVKYFGDGDECHAGYHFPLMPQIFKALGQGRRAPIMEVLQEQVTPAIAPESQWFMFLRCHDELTLEMVTPEDRKYLHSRYCRDPRWDFRVGEGISARLAELFDRDPQMVGLAYSVMLTLPGTPIVYYGDEFGKGNDEQYYEAMKAQTGKNDTRYFVRGRVDWEEVRRKLKDGVSFSSQVFGRLKTALNVRRQYKAFGRGQLQWLTAMDGAGKPVESILAYARSYGDEKIIVVNNLGDQRVVIQPLAPALDDVRSDLLGHMVQMEPMMGQTMGMVCVPRGYYWFKV